MSQTRRDSPATRLRRLWPTLPALLLVGATACTQYAAFDSAGYLRAQAASKLEAAAPGHGPAPGPPPPAIVVPFELSPELIADVDSQLGTGAIRETYRVEQVLDYVFRKVGLRYNLFPTRDAVGAYTAREGNCLSFVNLFVGISRHVRLDPFYVEVVDHQRWRHQNGMVLSQGHIVAGMYVAGELKTYDFLPYRPKSYKKFTPIDDLEATAHYYNNLAAEALLDGDTDGAEAQLAIATTISPTFEKALNNLGVVRARRGDTAGALTAYQKGLDTDPSNGPILTNLARLYQQMGRLDDAAAVLAKVEDVKTTNPFYYLYRGELELTRGDPKAGLELMREAFRLDSELPEVHVGLAKAYLALGELGRAKHHVERALQLDATHREARDLAVLLAGSPKAQTKP